VSEGETTRERETHTLVNPLGIASCERERETERQRDRETERQRDSRTHTDGPIVYIGSRMRG